MIRCSFFGVTALALAWGCSGSPVTIGSGDAGPDHASVDGSGADGGSSCTGTAPNCFGGDDTMCCAQDPAGPAKCVGGEWMCGGAKAPGCNGKSCLLADSGSDASSCVAPAPNCFGNDDTQCCGQDPSGVAMCVGTEWMCGSAKAPGCDGTKCILGGDGGPPVDGATDAGGPPDVVVIDAGPPTDAFTDAIVDGGPPTDVIVIDAGPAPDGFVPCGPKLCAAGDTCVITKSSGGPCLPVPDSGACPPKTVKEGLCCVFSSTTFSCQPTPKACGGTPSCACASSLCTGCSCMGASGDDLSCECFLP